MKIAIDFDSTLINTPEVWMKLAHDQYDSPMPRLEDVHTWNLEEHLGITTEQLQGIFNDTRDSHMKYAAPVDANFPRFLREIIAAGHECYVLTKNPASARDTIEYWLAKYGFHLDVRIVDSIEAKFDAEHEWDVLIDDAPDAITEHNTGEHAGRTLIVYTAPWNVRHDIGRDQYRAYNWSDVEDQVRRIYLNHRMLQGMSVQ